MTTLDHLPEILVRERHQLRSHKISGDSYTPVLLDSIVTRNADANNKSDDDMLSINSLSPQYSPNGSMLAIVKSGPKSIITILESATFKTIGSIKLPDLGTDPFFSPQGNFLVTWSHHRKKASEEGSNNLRVWKLYISSPIASSNQSILPCEVQTVDNFCIDQCKGFCSKTFNNDALQFSSDDRFLFHIVTNEVHIYDILDSAISSGGEDTNTTSKNLLKLVHKGISGFRVSPVQHVSDSSDATIITSSFVNVAVFVPEISGKPASTTIYRFNIPPIGASTISDDLIARVGARSMFAASEAKLLWNKQADALLAHTHCDVDKSNSSYYGSSGLFYLKIDKNRSGENCRDGMVPLSKQGAVHDVQWSPLGDKFAVCSGNMPSQSTLFNSNMEAVFEFGTVHRNTISWSPHGRFLCVAGFGNLAGEIDFYDSLRLRKIGSNSAHAAVTHGWSPDSRYFLTATVSPRMNVDNGFKIFKYNGIGPVVQRAVDVAYDILWKVEDVSIFPARGPSPKRDDVPVASLKPAAVAAPYRPPAYRAPGSSSSAAFSGLIRDTGPTGKIKSASAHIPTPTPPPAPQKPKRVIPGMAAPQPPMDASTSKPKQSNKHKAANTDSCSGAPQPAAIPALNTTTTTSSSTDDVDKKIKALKKKLKQVEDIKAKQASGSITLNDDQRTKLESETALLRELEDLQLSA